MSSAQEKAYTARCLKRSCLPSSRLFLTVKYSPLLLGNMKGYRECHIKPDLLLIYSYIGDEWLRLERLGTHADIFGL